jgi:hypothetical protein
VGDSLHHFEPAADVDLFVGEVGDLLAKHLLHVPHLALPFFRPADDRTILEVMTQGGQRTELGFEQGGVLVPTAEEQPDRLGDLQVKEMMDHASQGSHAGAGGHEDRLIREGLLEDKVSVRTGEGHRGAGFQLPEEGRGRSAVHMLEADLHHALLMRGRGDGVGSLDPARWRGPGRHMDNHKLSCLEGQVGGFDQPKPETADVVRQDVNAINDRVIRLRCHHFVF